MISLLQKISRNTFFRSSMLYTITALIVGFINYVFNSLSAKALGPKGYGEIAALSSYILLVSVPISALSTEMIRILGARKDHKLVTVKLWEQWMYQKAVQYWFLIIPFFLIAYLIPALSGLSLLSSFTLLGTIILFFLASFYTAVFQGLHRFTALAAIMLISVLVKLMGPLIAVPTIDPYITIVFFLMCGGITSVAISRFLLVRSFRTITIPKSFLIKERRIRAVMLNKKMIITIMSLVGVTILSNIDLLYAKRFFSATDAGLYGSWNLFGKIIYYIMSPLISISLVFFSGREFKKYHSVVLGAGLVLFLIAGASLFTIYSLFKDVLLALIFSSAFSQITQYIPYASIFGFLYASIYFLNVYFLTKNSLLSITPLVLSPFYLVSLYFFGEDIQSVIFVTLLSTATIFFIYLSAVIYYNVLNKWKKQTIIS